MFYRADEVVNQKMIDHFGICEKDWDEAILRGLGADFFSGGPSLNDFYCHIPKYIGPEFRCDQDDLFFFTFGIKTQCVYDEQGRFLQYDFFRYPPLRSAETIDDIAAHRWPEPAWFDFTQYKTLCSRRAPAWYPKDAETVSEYTHVNEIRKRDDQFTSTYFQNTVFVVSSFMRGMDKLLLNMAADPKLAHAIVDRVGEACLEMNRANLAAIGDRVELFGMWDDFAMQNNMFMSPNTWREFFKPWYARIIAEAKRYGLIVYFHCCGNCFDVIGDLIDIGIDILDPIQTSARCMKWPDLKREFGRDICFHGGLDVQKCSESDAQKGIPTILSELANSELPGKSVRAFARRVHIRRGPETDPGSMTLVLHITLIPADKGDAPIDGKTIHAFLSQWFGNVTARGVKMMEEQVKTAPSDRGNGVDLEVSLTLPPARTPGAETKSFDDYGGGPSAKTKPFDDDIMGRIRANWDKIYIWDAETGSARPCDAGDLGIGLGRLPGMGSAGRKKSLPGAEVGPESDALKTGILTVLKELSADRVHAEVSRLSIRTGPETDTRSMAFVLDITLIPADKGGAPVDGKAVVAFLKQWMENVSTRGVTMIVGQIKTEPAGKGNGIDLEIAGTLAAKTNPDRAKAIAQIERIGGKISPEQRELKGAVQWKTSDGGNGHFYKMVAVPEEVTWTEAKRRPIATGGNLVTIASEGITWTEANRRAIAAGGHLVTITSKAENDFVFALVDHPEYWERMDKGPWMMGPWIGGVQAEGAREPDGGWQWVTGEPFAFTNWIPGDPNDNCKASGAVNRIC